MFFALSIKKKSSLRYRHEGFLNYCLHLVHQNWSIDKNDKKDALTHYGQLVWPSATYYSSRYLQIIPMSLFWYRDEKIQSEEAEILADAHEQFYNKV